MRLARFFIDRPVFAAVISITIILVGAIAALRLPIAEYPDIAPPTVQVTAIYPGAAAETIASTVAGPIEQEINGVDGMLYVSSQSTGDGRLTTSVVFRQRANVQVAAGAIGQAPRATSAGAFEIALRAQGRLASPEQFDEQVIGTGASGAPIRLRDVARTEIGAADYTVNALLNNRVAT